MTQKKTLKSSQFLLVIPFEQIFYREYCYVSNFFLYIIHIFIIIFSQLCLIRDCVNELNMEYKRKKQRKRIVDLRYFAAELMVRYPRICCVEPICRRSIL